MKIAIHHRKNSYSERWIEFCKERDISYKIVNAYDTDIISQVSDCDAFMWHHDHGNYKDKIFAKELLTSLQQSGKIVFPNIRTGWHFDDKLGQKYLFEAHGIRMARTWAFFDAKSAKEWIAKTSFPKIYKKRSGAGASSVYLVANKAQAERLVKSTFDISVVDSPEFWLRKGREGLRYRVKSTLRRFFPKLDRHSLLPHNRGYIYFQEYIPNDGFDYRLEIVGDKCIAVLRYNRKNDFRASGGHDNHFDKDLFPKDLFEYGFYIHKTLGLQSSALDIVQHKETGEYFLIEISYCYGVDTDEYDHGYWTADGILHEEPFNGQDWMIEQVIKDIEKQKSLPDM